MSRFAECTSVSSEKSRAEIERTLSRYGSLIRFHRKGCWEWVGFINAHRERGLAHSPYGGRIPELSWIHAPLN